MTQAKHILLGITGGIAAYKSCELCRLLVKNGHIVKVVMTEHAKMFIHPNTFAALSGHAVHTDNFSDPMIHITLAKWADKMIIAPATANMLAKLNVGLADDLLSTICLATEAPIFLAPAMNKVMWQHTAVQQNINNLDHKGFRIIAPTAGEQACGDVGLGRMAEPNDIFNSLIEKPLLKGKTILITAGPTREPIDPIRHLSNYSSGKMGYALAKAAKIMGAKVVLISGPTCLTKPNVDIFVAVNSAEDMLQAVLEYIPQTHIFISAAAVADYTPLHTETQKIKKSEQTFQLSLKRTQDILMAIKHMTDVYKVEFCAETENLEQNAQKKLTNKSLDAIIANKIHTDGFPFNAAQNELTWITPSEKKYLTLDTKQKLAFKIVKLIHEAMLNN